jgi:hypothetical protein
MVSSKKSDSVGVLDLEAEEILKSFDGVVASIDKISDEDIAVVFDITS